jgi:hypothetical protein
VLRGQVCTDSFCYGLSILPLKSTRFGIHAIDRQCTEATIDTVRPSTNAQQAKDREEGLKPEDAADIDRIKIEEGDEEL